MMYTTHGAHIPGTRLGNNPPVTRPRCGGLDDCSDCGMEAEAVGLISYTQEDTAKQKAYDYICKAGVDSVTASLVLINMSLAGIVFRERENRW
jgi:hypothetical protein